MAVDADIKAAQDQQDVLIEELGYDDHFHEHEHGDKYQSSFITKYIFSQDHKIISKQFLITGIFWAVIGSAMSVIFRLQLGFPEESLTWIKPLLGKWIVVDSTGMGSLDRSSIMPSLPCTVRLSFFSF